jgi:hypothetical protein
MMNVIHANICPWDWVLPATKSHGRKLEKRILQRTLPLGKSSWLDWPGGYIRAGRFAGRRADVGWLAAELEVPGRENVVIGASGLVNVGGIDELWEGMPNSEVIVT